MFMDKKILLACAKNTTEYIKNNNGGNFTGFIVDIIRYVNKQKMDSKQKAGQLWRILFNVKNSNIEIIGGGKSIKESYIKFIDEFLCIKKYKMNTSLKMRTFAVLIWMKFPTFSPGSGGL